ncbi:MAG: hypothetical protein FWD12_06245 [Alphaproteobacteria bacterium]|nr:hypothetical protein [Alphaproteobacteria bacterium]
MATALHHKPNGAAFNRAVEAANAGNGDRRVTIKATRIVIVAHGAKHGATRHVCCAHDGSQLVVVA